MKYFLSLVFLAFSFSACNGSSSNSAPNANTSLTVSGPQVNLTWTASSGSPHDYYIEQSSDGTNFVQVQTSTTASASILGVTAGSTYYYRIRAHNSGGVSAYTSAVSITVPTSP